MEESHLNPQEGEEGEKEEGELEEGELEDEDEETQLLEGSGEQEKFGQLEASSAAATQGSSSAVSLSHHHHHPEDDKEGGKDGEHGAEDDPFIEGDHKAEEDGRKREGKSSKDEKKRKHKDDDDEKERRRKKKKKRRHVSSDEEEEEMSPVPKFHRKMIPQSFDGNLGFDAMLQQEMYLRGRSPPPGMVPYGPPPGAFGPPMFRGHPMSDYDSYDSGSDSERHGRRRRRRHRRSRSRSRSPSCKNEAICMYYMQGSCKRGKGCPYSHDIQPQRKMELCKFYMMDCCAKKEKCLYMHKDFPCKYYHTGLRCKLASKCKFSHGHLADSAKQILLKHIELAPKDILGDFPRLTKEAAQLVVDITEAHRRGQPLNVENLPGIMDMKGRGFKYVDKAIRALEKKHEKNLQEQEDQDREEGFTRVSVMGNLDDQHLHQQSHEQQQQQHHLHQQISKQEKMKHNREEQEGIASPRRSTSPTPMSELVNGEGQQSSLGQGGNSSHMGLSPGRKLGRFMAGMPQKQRELFQRIQQQHSVHDDQDDGTGETGGIEDSSAGTSNVNWYSSDEEGDGSSPSKSHAQSAAQTSNLSPSRTPPLPHQATSPSHGSLTPPGRPGSSPANSTSSTSPKTPFSNINLANINISSDLASVLSALKSQNAANANRSNSDETGRGQMTQSPRRRDPRELSRELSQDMSRDPREVSRDLRDIGDQRDMSKNQSHTSRDPRGSSQGMKLDLDYSQNTWMRDQQSGGGRWDSHRDVDTQKDARGMRSSFSEGRETGDMDSRQRTGDIDLRILPGIEEKRPQGPEVKGLQQDTDMRISSEPSIYDVDLRQLGLPTTFKDSEEDLNSLPFKVPMHTPAKEIVASISSHSPMYYQLVKVCIPKPNFSNLKINKDDPKILEDPRLRKMLRRNSTEENSNRSPRAPSRYELDGPMSPPPFAAGGKNESNKFVESESRDPRMSGSRDPRAEPRVDPRSEHRGEPRGDPRMGSRNDPRMGSRGDPRTDSRDPRTEQLGDMRNQDPRMFGGNGGGMMDGGGMPFNNMGGGPMGGVMPPRNVDPRGRPGLLGPAPMPFAGGVPHGMGPRMPPFMMGQMGSGPNGGFYPDDGGEMMGGGGYPQGGPGWGGRMMSNDPRLKRDMGDGRSYTPPPVS